MRTIVIGYGNTLRSDDGIGPRVAQRVARLVHTPRTMVLVRQVLTPDLAGVINGFDRGVFIDASAVESPGSIRERWILPPPSASPATVHSLEVADLLALCQAAYDCAPETILITVGGRSFELGEELSLEIKRTIPLIVKRTLELAGCARNIR